MEMLLTGETIGTEDAEPWGLVNKVVPEDQLEEAIMALANKLAKKSPVALRMGRQAFYGISEIGFGNALEYSNEIFASPCVTEDTTEGINDFLEKLEPDWKEK